MSDDLVERVAREMWEAIGAEELDGDDLHACKTMALAAIAVALEEAAKACQHIGRIHRERGNIPGTWSFAGCEDCAAAIRAMIPKENK